MPDEFVERWRRESEAHKARFAQQLAEVEAEWATLGGPQFPRTPREVYELCVEAGMTLDRAGEEYEFTWQRMWPMLLAYTRKLQNERSASEPATAREATGDGVTHRRIRVGDKECDLSELEEAICRCFPPHGNGSIVIAELCRTAWGETWGETPEQRKKVRTRLSKLGEKLRNAGINWSFYVRRDSVEKESL